MTTIDGERGRTTNLLRNRWRSRGNPVRNERRIRLPENRVFFRQSVFGPLDSTPGLPWCKFATTTFRRVLLIFSFLGR